MNYEHHEPVLLKEVLEYLDPRRGNVIVDATFGFGGHSLALLEKIGPSGRIIAIEQDERILNLAKQSISDPRITVVNENFKSLPSILKNCGLKQVDRILLDLGISSYHFDKLGEGFSFLDQKLDMRLSHERETTAADLVNDLPENELADLLYLNADEYNSRRIARAIIDARQKERIESAEKLAEVITMAVRRRGKVHPATKTFQALRIAVNEELNVLSEVLPEAINSLKASGRVAVISFHSQEDRIVKHIFKNFEKEGTIKILTKKPIIADTDELKANPRSRSAKLRVAVKI